MNLKLERKWLTERSTIGELYIDGERECFTLEDYLRSDPDPSTPANEAKVPGTTAIPAGHYQVILSYSNRFKTILPELLNVPGFTAIRIHSGNVEADTLGCILIGTSRATDAIHDSRRALAVLLPKIEAGLQDGPVTIEIVETPVS